MTIDKSDLANAITASLVAGDAIACELGTFFFVDQPASFGRNPMTGGMVPIPAKREARFLPSDALLARAAPDVGLREADYRAYLAQDTVGDSSLTIPDVYCDADDEKPSVQVSAPARSIELGALFDELASTLAAKKKVRVSGIGTLRLAPVRRGKLARKRIVVFESSVVLKEALNRAVGAA